MIDKLKKNRKPDQISDINKVQMRKLKMYYLQ